LFTQISVRVSADERHFVVVRQRGPGGTAGWGERTGIGLSRRVAVANLGDFGGVWEDASLAHLVRVFAVKRNLHLGRECVIHPLGQFTRRRVVSMIVSGA